MTFQKQTYINTVTVDHRAWTGAIENQMSAGSCTGFAVTNAEEILVNRLTGSKVDLSGMANYYASRSIFGGQNVDGGSFVKYALQAAQNGNLLESQWSSTDMQHVNAAPPASLYSSAPDIKITSWEKLDFNPDSQVQRMGALKAALQAGYTPIMESDVNVKFMFEDRQLDQQMWNNPTLSTTGQYATYGRHATVAEAWMYGHNIVENQWRFSDGKLWGDQGFGMLDPVSSGDSAYIITGMQINGKQYDMHYTDSRVWANKFYVALFNRGAEVSGMDYWAHLIDGGMSLSNAASAMAGCTEAKEIYTPEMSNQDIVKTFYNNVLGRETDQSGLQYWTNQLATKSFGQCTVDMINAVMNYSGTDQLGLQSKALFENKLAVSTYNAIMRADDNVQTCEGLLQHVTADVNTVTVAEIGLVAQLHDFGWG